MFQGFDPNSAAEGMKKALQEFSKIVPGGDARNFAEQLLMPKKKYSFTVNGKEGEAAIMNSGAIIIAIKDHTDDDVKEIVRRLLTQ